MNPATPSTLLAERRANDSAVLMLVQAIQADVTEMRDTLHNHISTEPKEWAKVLTDLMIKSFPGGDADGHRAAHEAQMRAIQDRAAFWKTLLAEVTKYGILGVLGWLTYHAWVAFLHGPKG